MQLATLYNTCIVYYIYLHNIQLKNAIKYCTLKYAEVTYRLNSHRRLQGGKGGGGGFSPTGMKNLENSYFSIKITQKFIKFNIAVGGAMLYETTTEPNIRRLL
jgi:hypothetical protein